MASFRVNETHTTDEPTITVETLPTIAVGGTRLPSPLNTLVPGRHRFQLVVEDNNGNRSEPAFVDVIVTLPTVIGPGGLVGRGGIGGLDILGGRGGPVRPVD